jgi:protein-tyrosine-phosphatase
VPDGLSLWDFSANPFRLTLAKALQKGCVLTEAQYGRAPERIALVDERFVEDIRGGLSSLHEESQLVLETAEEVFHDERTPHSRVSSVPLAEVAAITFLQRGPGKEWTSDQINDEDIVINLLGEEAGEVCRGRPEQEEAFVRIARVRVTNPTVIDVEYLDAWLSYMGKQFLVSGSRTVKRIGRSSVANLLVPLPAIEVQKKIGRQVKQVRDACTQAEKLAKTFEELKRRLPQKLFDRLTWGKA